MFFFFASSLFRSIMSEEWDSNSTENWHYIWSNDTTHDLYSDTNNTYVNYYLHQPQVAAIFIISYFLIFFLCMVGNTVVCFIVMRNKHMHTVTNLFILNLAISDLLVGIFCMPITLLDNIIAGMLIYSSILAWKIPWMEEPGGLQSMGSQTVGHDWVTSLMLICVQHKDNMKKIFVPYPCSHGMVIHLFQTFTEFQELLQVAVLLRPTL